MTLLETLKLIDVPGCIAWLSVGEFAELGLVVNGETQVRLGGRNA